MKRQMSSATMSGKMSSARAVMMLTLLLVLLPCLVSGQSSCRCSEKLNNGYGYLFCSCPKTWEEANGYCEQSYQGSLAFITNQPLQDLMQSHLDENRASDTWIGARGILEDWHWISDGQRISYQGCFKDDPTNRDLDFDVVLSVAVTPENCIAACAKDNQYQYAGLQAGSLCFCGNAFGKHGYNTDGCSSPCSGDFNLNCGGALSNDVYSIGGSWSGGWVFGSPSVGSGGIDDLECMVYRCETFFGWSWQSERCERQFGYLCMFDYDNTTCIARGYTPTAETCISYPQTDPVSWFEAKTACIAEGGRLLELRSALSHWAIRAALADKCTLNTLWVGATKVDWRWANKKQVSYTNWATSRPANAGNKCVAMSFKLSREYEWADVECDKSLNFLCERPIGPTTTTTSTTTTTTTPLPTTTTTRATTSTTTTRATTRSTTSSTTTSGRPTTSATTTEKAPTVVPPTRLGYSSTKASTSSVVPTSPSSSSSLGTDSTTPLKYPSSTSSPGGRSSTPDDVNVIIKPTKPANATGTDKTGATTSDKEDWIPIYIGIAVAAAAVLLIFVCLIYCCCCKRKTGSEKTATMRVENGYSNRAGFVHDGDFAYKTHPSGVVTPTAKNGGHFPTGNDVIGRNHQPYVAAVTPNNASTNRVPPISVVPPNMGINNANKPDQGQGQDFPDNVTSTVTSASSAPEDDNASVGSSVSSSSSVYIGEFEDQGVGVKYVHPRDEEAPQGEEEKKEEKPKLQEKPELQEKPAEVSKKEPEVVVTKTTAPTPSPPAETISNQPTLPLESRKLTHSHSGSRKGPAPTPPKGVAPSSPTKTNSPEGLTASQFDISTRL